MHGSSQKVIPTVLHAFVTHFFIGSGAMGSRFREQLPHCTDLAVFTQLDQWKGYLSAVVTAHEDDIFYMRNFLEEITKNKYNQGGLALKDIKPDIFESNEKSKLSLRQWSDEFPSWVERIDQDFDTMLRLAAQMQEWDKDKFIAAAQQDHRLGAEKVTEFDKHIYLAMKRFTAGIAREIVDTSKTAGEAGKEVAFSWTSGEKAYIKYASVCGQTTFGSRHTRKKIWNRCHETLLKKQANGTWNPNQKVCGGQVRMIQKKRLT